MKTKGKLDWKPAKLQRPGRSFSLNYRVNKQGEKVIVDIPTILRTPNGSFEQRRKLHKKYFDKAEWELLEQQELERFTARCQVYTTELEEKHPECENKCKIVSEWAP